LRGIVSHARHKAQAVKWTGSRPGPDRKPSLAIGAGMTKSGSGCWTSGRRS